MERSLLFVGVRGGGERLLFLLGSFNIFKRVGEKKRGGKRTQPTERRGSPVQTFPAAGGRGKGEAKARGGERTSDSRTEKKV